MTDARVASQLSDVRNDIRRLGDRQALDFVSQAIAQHHRGHVAATEAWLRMAVARVDEIGRGEHTKKLKGASS
jgi:hypothetical protein